MKKFSILTLVAILAFTLVACTGGDKAANENSANGQENKTAAVTQEEMDAAVKEIKDKGKLVLATSADYPPYEWHLLKDGKDEIVGFDIEIAKALAESIGVELEIKDIDFDGILPAITSGQADIGIAGLSATPERLEAVNMTDPYYTNKQVMIVPKDKAENYKSMADFAGKTVGAQTGSVQESTIRENFPKDVELKSLPKLNNLVMEVKNGTADGLVISKSSGEQYAQQFPELTVIEIDIPEEPGVCIATKKGNDALTAYMNQALKKLIDAGKVEEWIKEYEQISSESTGNAAAEGEETESAN